MTSQVPHGLSKEARGNVRTAADCKTEITLLQ
jgi:hypothetical protein